MKEAMFYKKLKDSNVQCLLCGRNCVIPEGKSGFCRVRKNIKGKLYSLVYGKLCSIAIDPIEKKPLNMFAPGSYALSISTVGCNFRCSFCCNYSISQEWSAIVGEDYDPEGLIDLAKKYNAQGFSYTYVEPTIFYEFAYETAKLASKNGFYNMFVTNGYTTPEAIKEISKYLDAAAVDLKCSGNPEAYKKLSQVPEVQPIFDALLAYKENKIYVEITDLIIPKYGDKESDVKKLCKWIVENLGPETPLHFIQFFPSYRLLELPRTPVKIMESIYEIAKREGLKYVYLGNVHGHKYENTFCPNCGKLLIKRTIMGITEFLLKKDLKCPNCGEKIPIFGIKWIPERLWK
jgi:pyruvate formate lyase activating enzyme